MPPRKSISETLRRKVAERAKYLCEYCKAPKAYSPGPFDTEHIIPFSLSGDSSFENLAYACNGCNGHKYNKTSAIDPVDEIEASLFNPRLDIWTVHFAWNENGAIVIGLTPQGRATVDAFNLNRTELLNLRKLLRMVGEHPPVEE